jgi:hypothetical protein
VKGRGVKVREGGEALLSKIFPPFRPKKLCIYIIISRSERGMKGVRQIKKTN